MPNRQPADRDIISQLGPLAFASRLRRLSEQLLKDVSLIYRLERVNFEARWFPIFYLLARESPLAVTEVAQRLQLTHPAVNQVAGALERAGLIDSRRDQSDDRRRLLALSAAGRRLAAKLEPVWQDIRKATADLLKEGGVDLLTGLEKIEQSLVDKGMFERVSSLVKQRQLAAVEIVNYRAPFRQQFRRLNEEWLKKYFSIEPADRLVLEDPEGQIIGKGGRILFARLDNKIVGCVALVKKTDSSYELAKMAVTESAQGRQVGRKLALEAIAMARKLGASEVSLLTSPKLTSADGLYRSLGFEPLPGTPALDLPYQRSTIAMKLRLRDNAKPKRHRSKS